MNHENKIALYGAVKKRMRGFGVLLIGLLIAAVCVACGGKSDQTEPAATTNAPAQTTQGTQNTTTTVKPPETDAPEVPPIKELTVLSVEEQGDAVLVNTSYCTLRYPYAFSDLIGVEAVTEKDRAALKFTANISGAIVELYTLRFDHADGIPVGTLTVDGEDSSFTVTVVFAEAAQSLSQESLTTFYAVQETFNDVVVSLAENAGFTPAG